MRFKGLDSVKIIGLDQVSLPGTKDFPKQSLKFASLRFAKEHTTDYVNNIIDQAKQYLKPDYRHTFVDIKTHHLKKGQSPALRHWHFDCIKDQDDPAREENHLLFISGVSYTEFLSRETHKDIKKPYNLNDLNDYFSSDEAQLILPMLLYNYGRHLHRATPATHSGSRLLIRLTQTNKFGPKNQLFSPTYR